MDDQKVYLLAELTVLPEFLDEVAASLDSPRGRFSANLVSKLPAK
jgi:hypothetical protein